MFSQSTDGEAYLSVGRLGGELWKSPRSVWGRGLDRDPGETRTPDLEIRSHMLYPAELQGQT